jgi:hypothetical protein
MYNFIGTAAYNYKMADGPGSANRPKEGLSQPRKWKEEKTLGIRNVTCKKELTGEPKSTMRNKTREGNKEK